MLIKTVADFRMALRFGPYAWPGGYDHYFVTSDGGCLCHTCADAERRNIVDSVATKCDDGWRVVALDATCNTDSEVRCDHCSKVLQEAYCTEYVLPSYWASYLINGDASGLEDGEQDEIDRWVEQVNPGHCVDCSEDTWFAHSNDAGTLAGDVCTYKFLPH